MLVHLKCCEDMSAADDNGLSDPYCTLTLGKKSVTSAIKYRTCDPQFDEKHDWSEVCTSPLAEAPCRARLCMWGWAVGSCNCGVGDLLAVSGRDAALPLAAAHQVRVKPST